MNAAELTQLVSALIIVESNGRDSAIGDGGLAVGPLQIHRGVVEDVNRLEGTSYTWKSMTNRVAARKVCALYLKRYAEGRDQEYAARIWNGGPKGPTKSATDRYWARVNRVLQQQKSGGAK